MRITNTFDIHGTHNTVRYTIEESAWFKEHPRLKLYLWFTLSAEYIFVETVDSVEHAYTRIDVLVEQNSTKYSSC